MHLLKISQNLLENENSKSKNLTRCKSKNNLMIIHFIKDCKIKKSQKIMRKILDHGFALNSNKMFKKIHKF